MSEKVLLKLGGSVITHKGGACSPAVEQLQEIAGVIREHREGLILVHGAGSCGHPEAMAYRLKDGIHGANLAGVYATHRAVRSLNDIVVSILQENGVEAVGVHPLCAGTADRARIVTFDIHPLEGMLDLGIIPVLHGDVVMDRTQGACIVSGDQLLTYLASAMSIKRVGLATDVPGVLEGSRVVRRLDPTTARRLSIGTSKHTDVTGGMQGKVQELMILARHGIDAHIFHISRLADFLGHKDHGGTIVCGEV
ncbi:MAG: isopentenyl phosphate kinase family protein [Methanomicrobiales archaeon]|nr:isopentenyl phosphate kinase family protein [Methanomicrobiales archaeon]